MNEHGVGMHLHHDDRYGDELRVEPAAWTAPRTWVTSELVTSAIMNTHVRDNLLATTQHGTALPASPTDGEQHVLVDSLTAPTYQWRFRYNAGSSSSYKWEFVGGVPASGEILTSESPGSAGAWVDLGTVGPSVTAPRAGEYDIEVAAMIGNGSAGQEGRTAAKIGAAAVSDDHRAWMLASGTATISVYRHRRRVVVAASDVIKQQYYGSVTGCTFAYRTLTVTPVRVS